MAGVPPARALVALDTGSSMPRCPGLLPAPVVRVRGVSRRPSRRPAADAPPRRTGRRDGELTVDELAAETGMTVRNVRAYSSRGLLPPPRLEGRTGYYGPDHVARLTLVREMLDQGYTLTAAEKLISAAPGSGSQALGLYHALMSPWEGIEAEVVEPLSLAREAGIAFDRALIDRLIELGLGVETEDARLEIDNPNLVRAGLQVIAAGVPADRVLGIVPALREHADAVSALFVGLVFDSLWKEFVDAGMPARQWPRMQQSIEEIIPLAGQALLAAFQASLGDAVTAAMRIGLDDAERDDAADADDPAEDDADDSDVADDDGDPAATVDPTDPTDTDDADDEAAAVGVSRLRVSRRRTPDRTTPRS
ncbi:MAG: transcriptional regulator, MerR family [Humibacillus sp.]|nr:transcriptional regulator, MerR family [Humibacillus sp.]